MRWILAIVVLGLIGGSLAFLGFFSPQVEAPIEIDAAATQETAEESSETEAQTETVATEPEAVESDPAASLDTNVTDNPEITATENWQFPEPDVVLQGEWYHIDNGCDRLVNDPPPTPMLRQIAVSTGFKPCFLCSKDDAERGPKAGAGMPDDLRKRAEQFLEDTAPPVASPDQ